MERIRTGDTHPTCVVVDLAPGMNRDQCAVQIPCSGSEREAQDTAVRGDLPVEGNAMAGMCNTEA